MATAKKRGGFREGSGRKPLQEGVETVNVNMKMTILQREKLNRLGGSKWVRNRIDKAREPDE